METDLDVHQFLTTIYRYIQLGVHIKAFYSKEYGKFHREIDEVAEFYVDDDNVPKSRIIYQKIFGQPMMCKPSDHLIEYIENQNIEVKDIIKDLPKELPIHETSDEDNVGENDENKNKNSETNNVENENTDVSVNTNEENVVEEAKDKTNNVTESQQENETTVENTNNNGATVANNTPVLAPLSSEITANKAILQPNEEVKNTPQNPQQNIVTPTTNNQPNQAAANVVTQAQTPTIAATQQVAQPQTSQIEANNGLAVNPNIQVPLAAPVVTPQTVPQQQMVINAQPTNNTVTQVPNTAFAGIAKLEE